AIRAALTSAERLAEYLERFQPDVLAFHLVQPSWEVYEALVARGWRFVFLTDALFVMVPATDAHASLIAREGYAHIFPLLNQPVAPQNAAGVLQEATRALDRCPAAATFAWSYKAKAFHAMGRYADAAEAGRHIPRPLFFE